MLLEELIQPKIIKKNLNRPILKNNEISPSHPDFLGRGVFSTVKQDSDPHLVKKTTKVPNKDLENYDPYWLYIDALLESNIADRNPFFPRIYSSSKLTGNDYHSVRRVRIEKLEKLTNFTAKNVQSFEMIQNIFSNISGYKLDYVGLTKYKIIYDLCEFIYDGIKNPSSYNGDNSKFKEAINFIHNLTSTSTKPDIHEDNLMLRRTSYGVQLVIIDPLFNKDYTSFNKDYTSTINSTQISPKTNSNKDFKTSEKKIKYNKDEIEQIARELEN